MVDLELAAAMGARAVIVYGPLPTSAGDCLRLNLGGEKGEHDQDNGEAH
jgi:hypothetical protein